jgi:hypothetical protein
MVRQKATQLKILRGLIGMPREDSRELFRAGSLLMSFDPAKGGGILSCQADEGLAQAARHA